MAAPIKSMQKELSDEAATLALITQLTQNNGVDATTAFETTLQQQKAILNGFKNTHKPAASAANSGAVVASTAVPASDQKGKTETAKIGESTMTANGNGNAAQTPAGSAIKAAGFGAPALTVDYKHDAELLKMHELQAQFDAEERRMREAKRQADEIASMKFISSQFSLEQERAQQRVQQEREGLALALALSGESGRTALELQSQLDAANTRWKDKEPKVDLKAANDDKKYADELKAASDRKAMALKLFEEIFTHAAVIGIPNAATPINAHSYTTSFIKEKLPALLELDSYFPLSDKSLSAEKIQAEMEAFLNAQLKLDNHIPDKKVSDEEKKKQEATIEANTKAHAIKMGNIKTSFDETKGTVTDGETATNIAEFISRNWTLAKKLSSQSPSQELVYQTAIVSIFSDNIADAGRCIPGLMARLFSRYVIHLHTLLAPTLEVAQKQKPSANKL